MALKDMRRKKPTQLDEFDLLALCLSSMESEGLNHQQFRMSFNEQVLAALNDRNGTTSNLEELHRLVDKCFANSWLEHTVMGNRYHELKLTSTGYGAARSRQRRAEIRRERSIVKKMSDYVIEHRGLFMVLGFLLALASFTFTVWRYIR